MDTSSIRSVNFLYTQEHIESIKRLYIFTHKNRLDHIVIILKLTSVENLNMLINENMEEIQLNFYLLSKTQVRDLFSYPHSISHSLGILNNL